MLGHLIMKIHPYLTHIWVAVAMIVIPYIWKKAKKIYSLVEEEVIKDLAKDVAVKVKANNKDLESIVAFVADILILAIKLVAIAIMPFSWFVKAVIKVLNKVIEKITKK